MAETLRVFARSLAQPLASRCATDAFLVHTVLATGVGRGHGGPNGPPTLKSVWA